MATAARFAQLQDVATRLRIDTIRATTAAGSGHATSCCSGAELMAALFFEGMRGARNGRPGDRFVLSKGHAAPLLYAAWAEGGVLPREDLMTLRRIDSALEGHPTPRLRGVDLATGSLGQGLSNGLGMALAERLDGHDGTVFVLLGDGECAEGNVWEAVELAGHYRLDNLVAVVDVNRLGQSQPTMLEHDLGAYKKRFGAFGWRAITVDGHDVARVVSALRRARRRRGQPTVVLARTLKGKGIPDLEDRDGWHGRPLDEPAAEKAIARLEEQLNGTRPPRARGVVSPTTPRPEATTPLEPSAAPPWAVGDTVATREAYGRALTALGQRDQAVVALDGDVKNSTYAELFAQACSDRYVEGFIAEQNLIGMATGLAVSGKIPFASSFGCFLSRAHDQIRMAAISDANLKLSGSHCGVSVGEDGPSQMALEDLAMLRALPGSVVLYPSDATAAWRAVELAANHRGIVYIRTTRPKTPVLYGPDEAFAIGGLKILRESSSDVVTVIAAGVTLHETLAAWEELAARGITIRVIDLYSVKPVDRGALTSAARATGGRLITVEDHYAEGGLGDAVLDAVANDGIRVYKLAVRELPRSGESAKLLDRHGINAAHIVRTVLEVTGAATSVGAHA